MEPEEELPFAQLDEEVNEDVVEGGRPRVVIKGWTEREAARVDASDLIEPVALGPEVIEPQEETRGGQAGEDVQVLSMSLPFRRGR